MTFRSCQQTVPRYLRIAFRAQTTVCVCVCVYIYIYTHTHTYIHIHTHIYTRIYVLARVRGVCHILVLSMRSALGNTK